MNEKSSKIYEELKNLNIDEIDWIIRNVIYFKSENLKNEQSIFLSQILRTTSSLFKQSFNGQIFDKNYLNKYYNFK